MQQSSGAWLAWKSLGEPALHLGAQGTRGPTAKAWEVGRTSGKLPAGRDVTAKGQACQGPAVRRPGLGQPLGKLGGSEVS